MRNLATLPLSLGSTVHSAQAEDARRSRGTCARAISSAMVVRLNTRGLPWGKTARVRSGVKGAVLEGYSAVVPYLLQLVPVMIVHVLLRP